MVDSSTLFYRGFDVPVLSWIHRKITQFICKKHHCILNSTFLTMYHNFRKSQEIRRNSIITYHIIEKPVYNCPFVGIISNTNIMNILYNVIRFRIFQRSIHCHFINGFVYGIRHDHGFDIFRTI